MSCSLNRSSDPMRSPPRTACFDIFSRPLGDSDVTNRVDRLNSKDTKIAPSSTRSGRYLHGRREFCPDEGTRGSQGALPSSAQYGQIPGQQCGESSISFLILPLASVSRYQHILRVTRTTSRHGPWLL